MRKVLRNRVWLVFVLTSSLLACKTTDNTNFAVVAYHSIWSELYPKTLVKKHDITSLQGTFYHAAAATSQAVAVQRWNNFLKDWLPANRAFEDAMHANFVTWAELESQRLHYIKHMQDAKAKAVRLELLGLAKKIQ